MTFKKIYLPFVLFTLPFLLLYQAGFCLEVPKLSGRINDYAGILSIDEKSQLDAISRNVESKTSSQLVLLTIPSLEGESLEGFSLRVAETWKLGQEKFDNGVLLMISMAEKKIRIEVGYGLESIVTDAKAGYIIRQLIVPQFKEGRFFNGIQAGLGAIAGIVNKEFDITPEQLAQFQKAEREKSSGSFPVGLIIFGVFILIGFLKRGSRGGGYSSGTPWIFYGGSSGRSSGSSFGSFGGGGFSGGGGSFGGGGSSGGW